MRKFAYSILGIFILLGGVLLGACQKQVSLSVSTNDVVIYTNDSNQENYQSKEIEVSVENSNVGVRVEIEEGGDCIETDKTYITQKKANGKYSFKILTKQDKKSGNAKVRVLSIDDPTKSEVINVSVKTILEKITTLAVDSQSNKSDRFAVRGIAKQLDVNQYFDPDPITANVADIDWSFEEQGSKSISVGGEVAATIDENDVLLVNEHYTSERIVIRATFKQNTSITSVVELAVLDNSTISNLHLEDANNGQDIYADGEVIMSAGTFNVKRNNREESKLEGTMVVNTSYDITFGLDIYNKNTKQFLPSQNELTEEERETKPFIEKYFSPDAQLVSQTTRTKTYSFVIESYDNFGYDAYGSFLLYFKVSYNDYYYDIRTDNIQLTIEVEYAAERVEVKHNGYAISQADIFSSYNDVRGFSLVPVVERSDIPIDNNNFRFSIDTQQISLRQLVGTNPISQLASFVAGGRELTFTPSTLGSAVYVSEELVSTTEVYVLAKGTFDNVQIVVESMSNPNVNTSLYVNFYEISPEQDLIVKNVDDSEVPEVTYMSTSQASSRRLDYEMKINAVTSLAGLELVTGRLKNGTIVEEGINDLFDVSGLTLKEKYDVENEKYIIVEFSISADRYNFADDVYFWFRHITGKKSAEFKVSAFVPITKASVQNLDKASADLYVDHSAEQAFMLDGTEVVSTALPVNSVSKLMVEAGTNLSLSTNYYGATLSEDGVSYKYLSYEEIATDMEALHIEVDYDIFDQTDLVTAARLFDYYKFLPFETETLFTINTSTLQIGNNAFKGFVCVLFGGYDDNHEKVTLARFFALESFYSVRYLSSNVTNKLLYTTTSLSEKDINRSYVDVRLSLRPDAQHPTYAGGDDDLDRLNFVSSNAEWTENSSKETYLDNTYYMISAISFKEGGRYIDFKITANSTNLQTSYKDLLTITYRDGNGINKKTEIQIEIKNAKRIESVVWLNRTIDDVVYMDARSSATNATNFTISTSVLPNDANDVRLTPVYSGSQSDFTITTSTVGQTVNVTINKKMSGTGYLYLIPTDMIKIVDSTEKILLYKYEENDTIEIPNYDVRLSRLDSYYENIVTGEGDLDVSPYFLNNDGERIYYSDIILRIKIVIADGSNEDLAIRVYGQSDLSTIDPTLYYEIANDITLTDWTAFPAIYKQIDGKNHTITFTKESTGSEAFVDSLEGKIKNLNFAGLVDKDHITMSNTRYAGFIANIVQSTGSIENCSVDVYNTNNTYGPSKLVSSKAVAGVIAGQNNGRISDSYVYGVDIEAPSADVGGLVGENKGTIQNCGVEFYKFQEDVSNKVEAFTNFGGLAGTMGVGRIEKSYVYDYTDGNVASASNKYPLVGYVTNAGATLSQVFAYFADEIAANPFGVATGVSVAIDNGYIAFENGNKITYYTTSGQTEEDALTDTSIWAEGGNVNFGHKYLANVLPSEKVAVENLRLDDVSVLNGQKYKAKSVDGLKGVLFNYRPTATIVLPGEKSALDNYNTIKLLDLFANYVEADIDAFENGVVYYTKLGADFVQVDAADNFDAGLTYYTKEKLTDRQARCLLMTSESRNIVISNDSLKVADTTTREFTISVRLKMDYSQAQDFTFIIVNAMPTLTTTIDGVELKNNQTILLQKTKTRNVYYSGVNAISLAGTMYAIETDTYDVLYSGEDEHVSLTKAGNSLILRGIALSEGSDVTPIETKYTIAGIGREYQEAIGIDRNFAVSVFTGATALSIPSTSTLNVTPADYAPFVVFMTSDNEEDDLVFSLMNGEVEIEAERKAYETTFRVDSNLALDVIWTKTYISGNDYRFNVFVRVNPEYRHLVDKDYNDLILQVNAATQNDNTQYMKRLPLSVGTQVLNDVSIRIYGIKSRQVRNSILYITRANDPITTIAPATDAIVAVMVDPAYAKMTHFKLTYTMFVAEEDKDNKGDGDFGSISISRIVYDKNNGYHTDLSAARLIENGILVNLTDADKTGDGIYYFRVYASNSFSGKPKHIKFTAEFFDGETSLRDGGSSRELIVSSLNEAEVLVDGESTYLIAKGQSVEVSVAVNVDQTLYSLYLQNNQKGILLSTPTYDIEDGVKTYRATLSVGLDALLTTGKDTGIFYVCATVERVINGVQEFKSSRAMVCLTDFTIKLGQDEVKASASTRQLVYNGKSYDAIYAYINEERELKFDYHVVPEDLEYDKNDANQVRIANEIERKRNEFLMNFSYGDNEASYYINYVFNEDTGNFDKLTLRQQLWYASSEGNVTKFYNDNYHRVTQNDYFNVEAPDDSNLIKIIGKRSGSQLMMLRTTIYYQGIEKNWDYYFLIRVDVWTDEDAPLEIATAEEFIDKATNGDTAAHYVLTSDIVLEDYEPVSTDLFNSFDGNGYTIHINSFKMPTDSNTLRLALFDTVTSNTLLKNVKVNIYNGGQIVVNYKRYTDIKIAGFAVTNNGIIYNCEVVAYYDGTYQSSRLSGETGLLVQYVKADGSDPVQITESSNVESVVAGFVVENESDGESGGTIVNSRVGGEETLHFVEIANRMYLEHISLEIFAIEGQGDVSGFVGSNSGYISASYANKMQIYNKMSSVSSKTAGFAIENSRMIQNSYVAALGGALDANDKIIPYNNLSNMSTMGIAAGFVYENKDTIRNSYANIAIDNINAKSYMASGFVYINDAEGSIELCYAACEVLRSDVGEMQFTGVDNIGTSLNLGRINTSYFYNETKADDSNESKVGSGAVAINDVNEQNTFYGFSFASDEGSYDGIWVMKKEGITLVSANKIALSNRYVKQVTGSYMTSVFYNNFVIDSSTYSSITIKYGSQNNPFIIKSAADFAKATGSSDISVYKEFFSDDEVFGNSKAGLIVSYRLVSSIDMDEIGQSESSTNKIKLTTTKKTLSNGLIDGNGFTIENINLGSNSNVESFGLFAKVKDSVIMNINLTVESVHDDEANVVGVLAGEAINTRILAINLQPTANAEEHTALKGKNIAGGVVGMLLGDSFMSDITVSSIDIEAVYFARNKEIEDNAKDIAGRNNNNVSIRDCADYGLSFVNNIKTLSYAGAVVGFVDIYNKYANTSTIYSTTLTVDDYNIITVRGRNSVNIYAETAGGLFGYVGKSTKIYDASIELDADMYLNNPSYIISKNLFAGGLVGENYGGLHAVYARYSKPLQDAIEKSGSTANAYSYYNGDTSLERGQSSIFSYTSSEEGYTKRTNNPKYIGGLVGYMGGGFMYVAYNKLNVVSHNEKTDDETKTFAVGGVVGLVGKNATFYSLNFMNRPRSVNILFYDVYASGDLYGKANTFSGGIIGSLVEGAQSTLAFKNVLALNYYSNEALENMNNHAMLIGGTTQLTADLFIIDNYNNAVLNVFNGDTEIEISLTVGGFKVTRNDQTMKVFGFNVKNELVEQQYKEVIGATSAILTDGNVYYKRNSNNEYVKVEAGEAFDSTARYFTAQPSILDSKILWVDDIERDITLTYARMTSYFIERGWEEKYWVHNQDTLYPEIELLPKLLVLYWDHYNTETIIEAMKSGSPIIIVRGRIDESSEECKDIDLTNLTDNSGNPIEFDLDGKAFTGKLYSHYAYMNSLDGAKLTQESYDNDTLLGGTIGQGAGIILNKQMFADVSSNALISGVNFYIRGNKLEGPIVGTTDRATIRGCEVVVTSPSLVIEECVASLSGIGGDQFRVAATLVGLAKSSTLINNNIRFREFDESNSVHVTFKQIDEMAPTPNDVERNYGLVVGYFYQTGTFMTATLQGSAVRARNLSDQTGKIFIDILKGDSIEGYPTSLYFGGHVGHVEKHDGSKLSSNFVTYAVDLTIDIAKNIETKTGSDAGMYVGAYAGYIKNADEIKVEKDNLATTDTEDKKININYNGKTANLYLGAMFGAIDGDQALEIVGQSGAKVTSIITNVYSYVEVGETETQTGYGAVSSTMSVGGFAGKMANNSSIAGFDIDTQIEFKNWNESDTTSWGYAIGGIVGLAAAGRSLTIANCNDVMVDIDVETLGNVNIGGLIGRTLAHTTQIQGRIQVNKNDSAGYAINVKAQKVHVGGVIGELAATISEEGNFIGTSVYNLINVDVTTIATDVVFGGVIGYVQDANSMIIQQFIYSGKFEHIVKKRATESLVVGGIVGAFSANSQGIVVDETLSLGDVFVNYYDDEVEEGETNLKLDSYVFGGVIGTAPSANKNVTLKTVYSLLTNYNNRTTYWAEHQETMNVGALIGANAGQVKYAPDAESGSTPECNAYYSSGVVLAYQEEGGIDRPYFSPDDGSVIINYKGYSSKVDLSDVQPQTASVLTNVYGGMSLLKESSSISARGTKVNPILYNAENAVLTGEGNSHGITWVAMGEDIAASEPVGSLENVAFVGNGFTFTRTTDLEEGEDYAAAAGAVKAGFANSISGHSIISNLLINSQISEDISNGEFGIVVGIMQDESFVYGVGVNGSASIGGAVAVTLSGIAGKQKGGWISNCYVDVDMIYRAKADASAQMSGISYIPASSTNDKYPSVSECYTSGSLTPYAKCHLAKILFAEEGAYGDAFDLYTITRIDETKIFASASAEVTDENQVIYGAGNFSYNDNNSSDGYTTKTMTRHKFTDDVAEAKTNSTKRKLYYDKAVNYGYGTLPFGFMRVAEIKAFTRNPSADTTDATTGKETYTYQKLTNLSEIDENAYYEVPSLAKLEDMLDYVYANSDAEKIAEAKMKFILRYDIDVSTIATDKLEKGTASDNFVLDGQTHNLQNYGTESTKIRKAIFVEIKGKIINLTMTNINVDFNTASDDVGILACKLTGGRLNNLHFEGTITNGNSGSTNVGGIVGKMTDGTINLVESILNITTTYSIVSDATDKNSRVAGIVAYMTNGTITNSSNNGIIKNESTGAGDVVAAGIVGRMDGGEVNNVYNGNAVLASFTGSHDISSYAGGIVGYIYKDTETTDLKVLNSYNIALVGAGNYSVTDGHFSYAGGIFAKAEGNIVVEACQNDGAVQALSHVENGRIQKSGSSVTKGQVIEITQQTGAIDGISKTLIIDKTGSTGLTNNPQYLIFKVTTKYNMKKSGSNVVAMDRQVYANGIGNGGTFSKDANATSKDNIKNDGNIGSREETKYLVFDRYAALNNDDKFVAASKRRDGSEGNWRVKTDSSKPDSDPYAYDYSFYGEFTYQNDGSLVATNADLKYTENGQDSYGFVKRLYMVDGIRRQYGKAYESTSKPYGNEVLSAYDHFLPLQWTHDGYYSEARMYYTSANGAVNFVDTQGSTDADAYISRASASQYFANDPYVFKGALMKYAESVSFAGYETYIDADALEIAEGYGDVVREEVEEGPQTIDQLVAGINSLFENSTGRYNILSVGGTENVAMTHNSDNYTAVTSPVSGSVEATFELDDPSTIDESSIKVVFSGDYQFIDKQYPLDFSASTSTKKVVKAKADFKYGNNDNAVVSAEVTYSRTYEEILLTKTNVTKSGSTTTITFDSDAGSTFKPEIAQVVMGATAAAPKKLTDYYTKTQLQAAGYTDADMEVEYDGSYSLEIDGTTYSSSVLNQLSMSLSGTKPQVIVNNSTLAGKNLMGKIAKVKLGYLSKSAKEITLTVGRSNSGTSTFNLSDDKYFAKNYDFDAYYDLTGAQLRMSEPEIMSYNYIESASGTHHVIDWTNFLKAVKQAVVTREGQTNYSDYKIHQIVLKITEPSEPDWYIVAYQDSTNTGGEIFAADSTFGQFSGSGDNVKLTAEFDSGLLGSARCTYYVNVNLDENSTTHEAGTIGEEEGHAEYTDGKFTITVDGTLGNRVITDGAPQTIGSGSIAIDFVPKTVRYTRAGYNADVTITTSTGNLGWTMTSTDNGIRQEINQDATSKQVYHVSQTYNTSERIVIDWLTTSRTISPNVELSVSGGLINFAVVGDENTMYKVSTGIATSADFYGGYYNSHSYVKTQYKYDTNPSRDPKDKTTKSYIYTYSYYVFDNGGFAVQFDDKNETKFVYDIATNTTYQLNVQYTQINNMSGINYNKLPVYNVLAGTDEDPIYIEDRPGSIWMKDGQYVPEEYSLNGDDQMVLKPHGSDETEFKCVYDENGVPNEETKANLQIYYQYWMNNGRVYYNASSQILNSWTDSSKFNDLMQNGFTFVKNGDIPRRTVPLDIIFGSSGNAATLIRNKNGQNLTALEKMETVSSDIKFAQVSLYEGTSTFTSQGDTISYRDGATTRNTTSSVIYPLSYVSTFVSENAAGDTLTATSYLNGDAYKFDILQNHQANLDDLKVNKTSGATIVDAKYILLTDNLYATKSIGSGDKELYADGHIINAVLTEDKSLFAKNETLVDSGVFVAHRQVGEMSLGSEMSIFIGENKTGSVIQNSKLYGSYRNAQKNVAGVSGDNYAKVYTIAKESVVGITSSVSVNVLDATNSTDKTVGIQILEKQESKDILISGDGYRGVDGPDGRQYDTEKTNRNGTNGTAGGDGGKIDLGTGASVVTCGFARGGVGGLGGLGGDGANGFYEQTDSSQLSVIPTIAYSKGEGGDVGVNGTSGQAARALGIAKYTENVELGNGLNGLGTFGRIYASSGDNGKYFVTESETQTEWRGNLTRSDGKFMGYKFGNVESTWTTFAAGKWWKSMMDPVYLEATATLAILEAAVAFAQALCSNPFTAAIGIGLLFGAIAALVGFLLFMATLPKSQIDYNAWRSQVLSNVPSSSLLGEGRDAYYIRDIIQNTYFFSAATDLHGEEALIYVSGKYNEVNYMIGNVPDDTGNYD